MSNTENAASIITGDFNNKGLGIDKAFPELFENHILEQAVKVKSTVLGLDEQFDHVLFQPEFFKPSRPFAELNGSDHLAIGVELDPLS